MKEQAPTDYVYPSNTLDEIAGQTPDTAPPGVRDALPSQAIEHTPRPPPSLASIPAGASVQLIRALRGLYEEEDVVCKRPWLLQPVLSSNFRETNGSVAARDSRPGGVSVDDVAPAAQEVASEVPVRGSSCSYVSVLDPRARAGSPPFEPWRPHSASRSSGRPRSSRPASSARAYSRPMSARDPSASSSKQAHDEAASRQQEFLQQARREKQEALRAWLQRKEIESSLKKRAQQQEENQNRQAEVGKDHRRAQLENSAQAQRARRVQSAARHRRERELELRYMDAEKDGAGLERHHVLRAALSAYGDTPGSLRPKMLAVM